MAEVPDVFVIGTIKMLAQLGDTAKIVEVCDEWLDRFISRPTPRALDECHRCGANLVTESSVHDGSVYCTACGTRQ